MKRQWEFDYILTEKGIKRASADVGFIFIAYNFKRIINIIGIKKLIELITPFWLVLLLIKPIKYLKNTFNSFLCQKSLNLKFLGVALYFLTIFDLQ